MSEEFSTVADIYPGLLNLRDWWLSTHYQSQSMFSEPSTVCHLMLPVSISSAIAPRPVALIMTGVDVLPERCRTPKHPFTLVTLVMSSRTQVLRQSTFRSIFILANPAFKTHQNQPPRVEGIKYMFLPEKIARGRCILYSRMVRVV